MKSPFLRRFGMPSPFFDNEAGFSPTVLLTGSTAFLWLDPSDLTTLFQDAAGTTPVTAPAQPVGLVLDKSQGLVLGPNIATVSSVTGVAIGGPATTNYDISPVMVAGRAYEISFTISGYSGSGPVGLSGNVASYEPDVPFASSSLSGNGTVRVIAISSSSVVPVRLYTQSTNTANFSNISVRELPGFHATQATAASRPTYGIVPRTGRRNLLTRTEEFDNAAWTKSNASISATNGTAPDGTATADTLTENTANTRHEITQSASVVSGQSYTFSAYVKRGSGSRNVRIVSGSSVIPPAIVNLSNGSVLSGSAVVTQVGDFYRISVSGTAAGTISEAFFIQVADGTNFTYTGDGASSLIIWGAQLELGSTATAYQRVGSAFDVTEAGVPSLSYLSFDGVDDFLVTPTITPNADKVQVFAGVRKLSDALVGIVAETSVGIGGNNGSLQLAAPFSGANYTFQSRGTTQQAASYTDASIAAPVTNVVTGVGDISGDRATLRVNGVQVAQNTVDQGTGNYLAYPLYIGRRGGTSLPFNGQLYGLIVRFGAANLDASLISNTERWMGGKTGVVIT